MTRINVRQERFPRDQPQQGRGLERSPGGGVADPAANDQQDLGTDGIPGLLRGSRRAAGVLPAPVGACGRCRGRESRQCTCIGVLGDSDHGI